MHQFIDSYQRLMLRKGQLKALHEPLRMEGFQAQVVAEDGVELQAAGPAETGLLQFIDARPGTCTDFLGSRKIVDLKPNQALLVPRQMPSWWSTVGTRGRIVKVLFSNQLMSHTLSSMTDGQRASLPDLAPCIDVRSVEIATLLQLLRCEMERREAGQVLYLDSLVRALAVALLRLNRVPGHATARAANGCLAPWQLRRAIERMEASIEVGIGLAELAAEVDLSPFHFARSFKRSTGLPPHAWLMARRMERAQALMTAYPMMGLMEIAHRVGYSSQGAFGTAFSRATGVSPKRWRRERAS